MAMRLHIGSVRHRGVDGAAHAVGVISDDVKNAAGIREKYRVGHRDASGLFLPSERGFQRIEKAACNGDGKNL